MKRARRHKLRIEALESRRLLATIVVSTPLDVVDANDDLTSLREAIDQANAQPDYDTILINPGFHELKLEGPAEDDNASGDLDITGPLTIEGGPQNIVIDAGGNNGILERAIQLHGDGDVTLKNILIIGGRDNVGGAIHAGGGFSGSLTLENVRLEDNASALDGGALLVGAQASATVIDSIIGGNTAGTAGGGIASFGTLRVTGSEVVGNEAGSLGGGIHVQGQPAVIESSTLFANIADFGGGISNSNGSVQITNSTISNNYAKQFAGGVLNNSNGAGNSASTRILNATIFGNVSGPVGSVHTFAQNGATDGSVEFGNTIFVDNRTDGTSANVTIDNDQGSNNVTLRSLGNNLLDDSGSGVLTVEDIIDVDTSVTPVIAPAIEDLGGPTRVYALIDDPSNPAIDGGNNDLAVHVGPDGQLGGGDDQPLLFDQRNSPFPRVIGGTVDIGAVELIRFDDDDLLVNTTDDDWDLANERVSLREALFVADVMSRHEQVRFDPNLISGGPANIALQHGELTIRGPVSVLGPGSDFLTVDAGGLSRVLQVIPGITQFGDYVISGLTLTGGNANTGNAADPLGSVGGGILSMVDLTLRDVTLTDNVSTSSGGGIASMNGELTVEESDIINNRASDGGGVFCSHGLQLESTSITGNTAESTGGGLMIFGGESTITDSVISGNQGEMGGGIYSRDPTTIENTTIHANSATMDGGGLLILSNSNISNTTISGNTAGRDGGGIHNDGRVTMSESTVSQNSAANLGGGISSSRASPYTRVEIESSQVSGNRSADGAGVANLNDADIRTSTVSGNIATGIGGGLLNTGSLVVSRSTISGNTAAQGGGLDHAGEAAFLRTSTVSGNSAQSTGGGIASGNGLVLISSTITGNIADVDGGGVKVFSRFVNSYNSILAGNSATAGADVHGELLARFTLIGDSHDAVLTTNEFNILDEDPRLGPLADNGGPTLTHELLDDSPALDAGAVQFLPRDSDDLDGDGNKFETVPFDQRGVPFVRIANSDLSGNALVDLGAFESSTITIDFGDAPPGFPVLLADDGARHIQDRALFLGFVISTENDGMPSENADADSNGDDGVTVAADAVVISGVETTSSFSINSRGDGFIDAWIDFNRDGDWQDSGEQIATSFPVETGENLLPYNVPGDAVTGRAAARFRLSAAGGLATTGEAFGGEVEDYLVPIVDGNSSPQVNVHVLNRDVTLETSGNQVVVATNAENLFAASADRIAELVVSGGDGDQLFELDATIADTAVSQLSLDGGGGENELRLVGGASEFDFTSSGNIKLRRISSIDLWVPHGNTLVLDAESVLAMAPTTGVVSVVGGGLNDRLTFLDAEDWRMGETSVVDGEFLRDLVNDVGQTAVMRTDFPNAWRNVLRISDVNNNGEVSAADALVIINELGRRRFSSAPGGELADPLAIAEWPGIYFDQNGDGRATALDALRVINELARITPGGESELFLVDRAINVDQAISELASRNELASRDGVRWDRPADFRELTVNFYAPSAVSRPARSVSREPRLHTTSKPSEDASLIRAVDQWLASLV